MISVSQKVLNGYEAGFVQRYHTHPRLAMFGQTDGHHSFGVAAIIIGVNPNPSLNLIKACITHDMGGRFCGDVPAPVKRDNPELKRMVDGIESDKLKSLFVNATLDLSEEESKWLRMADMMECYLFASLTVPSGLLTAPWLELRVAIEGIAQELMCYDLVSNVMTLALHNSGFSEAKTSEVYK